jgi:hypothetical protein
MFELSTLTILHEKGVLSDKEFEAAMKDAGNSTGERAMDSTTVVLGKWATTLYGFVEADSIYDTTQSLNDNPGMALIARPGGKPGTTPGGTYAGDNDRTQFGIRNSRIGLRIKAPEFHGIRVSGQAEMDFQGTALPICYANQPSGSGFGAVNTGYCGSESAFFTNPTFRVRHMNLKVETPIVDILMGQYWQLFGWQSAYNPGTVEIQGIPGELYARTPQLRVSKTIKTEPVTFEMAIAAMRPPQRNSATPEGQAGFRVAVNDWTGVQTQGSTNTSIQPASLAVTGDLKNVRLQGYPSATAANYTQSKVGGGIAVDAFLPLIPGQKGKMGNTLSFTGEFAKGYGIADQYSGLAGGTPIPTPTNSGMATAAMMASGTPVVPTSYAQDIDNGIVTFDKGGNLQFIEWHSAIFGLQYYLPGLNGRAFVAVNFSYTGSDNNTDPQLGGNPQKIRLKEFWGDANLFVDFTPAFRMGLEYANFHDVYGDGVVAINHRAQLSGFLLY